MTTPETPTEAADKAAAPPPETSSNEAHGPSTLPSGEAPSRPEPAAAQTSDAAHAAHADADDDGPQPGNAAGGDGGSDDDYGEGPAPGNEKFPGQRPVRAAGGPGGGAPGTPGTPGTGKKRRRRRKKGGAHAHAQGQGQGQPPAPGGEAALHEGQAEPHAIEGAHEKPADAPRLRGPQVRDAEQPRRKPKKDRPQRPDRERPAFNLGDVVFGKIIEITDEVLFIDLSGKGRAIFDRKEIDLPDEAPEPTPEERAAEKAHEEAAAAVEAQAAEAGADAQAEGHDDAAGADAAAPAEEQAEAGAEAKAEGEATAAAEAPAPAEAAAQGEAEAHAGEAKADGEEAAKPEDGAKAEGETEQEAAPQGDVGAKEEAKAEAEKPAPKKEEKAREPQAPLPPLVLEVGAHFVGVVHNDGGRGGLVVVTRHPRRLSKAKAMTSQALKDKSLVMGLVTGVIKGGLEVDIDGLRAFAPGSHVDVHKGADLSSFVGRRLDFYVTQYGKRGRDVVLSRKQMIEAEARATREEAIKKLAVGAIVDGVVRSVVPFGAFIDIGGVEGLVPLPEMSHNRADGPSDVFKPGEKTQVKIIKIDDKGKVSLSRKQAMPDPWMETAKKYAMGTKHKGKVVRIQPFGVFVELESGIDGLIHMADLSLKRIEHPSEVVKKDDELDVVVAHMEMATHKIGLHPALKGEQANEPHQRIQLHKMLKAQIVAAEAGGLLVRILGMTGRNARGFIPAPMTGTPRGSDLRKLFPAGTNVEGKVIDMDSRRGEVKLSIKALNEDTERNAYREYKQQVTKEARFTLGDLVKKHKES